MRLTERRTANFTAEEVAQLDALAAAEDRSVARLIRIAVLRLLRESAQTKPAEEVEK